MTNLTFCPNRLIRNPHFQTIVASLYHSQGGPMVAAAHEMILQTDEGVRLQGFYSPQPEDRSKGLVLLLHGWLGQANAGYNIDMGEYLYRHGYAIFRLNMRDHGNTCHLNPGLFRGDLLDEVVAAAQQIAQLEANRPFYVVGSSLGGNFAARLAWRHRQTPLPNLTHTVAISPALNPHQATLALDNGLLIYSAYFRHKWRRSLKKKNAAYPGRYDFTGIMAAHTCMAMTEILVRDFSPYANAQDYFDHYGVTPAMLATLQTPLTIVSAMDDPIIPASGLAPFLNLTPYLHLHLPPYGGHVGFIDLFPYHRWIAKAVLTILQDLRMSF